MENIFIRADTQVCPYSILISIDAHALPAGFAIAFEGAPLIDTNQENFY